MRDTTYEIVPMDPTPGWDLRDPATAAQYPIEKSLEELIVYRTSDDYYGRFFDTRVKYVPEQRGAKGVAAQAPAQTAPVAQQARPNTEVDESRVPGLAHEPCDGGRRPRDGGHASVRGGFDRPQELLRGRPG